ncbi:uPF0122 protein COPEUT_00364 [Coprococcus sp. CAG:782]|nr:uPF0122 protein COPEUT_00364 [Coprococcus sp. CAG:782]
MEKIVRQSMLYDFYGELLNEHQKSVYEDVVNNDLSYSEIAKINNISRQGVYDIIKRCDKILEEYEDKLHLVEKFSVASARLTEVMACIDELKEMNTDERLDSKIEEIVKLSGGIIDEF